MSARVWLENDTRLLEAFADRLAVARDEQASYRDPSRQVLRALSAALPKSDAAAFAAALRRGNGTIHATPLSKDKPRFIGEPITIPPMRVATRPLAHNLVQVAAVAETALGTDEDQPATVFVADGDEAGAFFRRITDARHVPMLDEWAAEVLRRLEAAGLVRRFETMGDVKGFDVEATSDKLLEIVQGALRDRAIAIPPGGAAPDTDLATLRTLDSYMLTFGRSLGERVLAQSPSRHTPGSARQPAGVGRRLYQAQADAAEAAAKTWHDEKTVWIVGEQGVGKTTIALAAARIHLGDKGRILVHCPGHLVGKWTREIQAVLGPVPTRVIRTYHDALRALPDLRRKPTTLEAWILPRDSAKLGYLLRPAAIPVRRDGRFLHWRCPNCGSVLVRTFKDPKRLPETLDEKAMRSRSSLNARCPACKGSLWTADRSGPRREAPSRILRRRLAPGTFDVLLADEIHEEKGDSAQGQSLGRLYALSRRAALLTGTLLGGKASDLFYHLARTQPERMRAAGHEYHNPAPFVRTYGTTEKRTRERPDGKTLTVTNELPGIHPAVYGDWLMGNSVFLGLEDLKANLPEYREEVVLVPMDEQQERMVEDVMSSLRSLAAAALRGGSKARLGSYIQAALAYPDRVWADEPIVGPDGKTLAWAQGTWDPNRVLPKEAQIVSAALREKARGRRSLVFCQFTGRYDVSRRLAAQMEDVGLRVALLTTDVAPEEREAWIARRVAEGVDVLVCHPRLVATGLDLVDFPTILWAQTGYSLFDVRQASRRSWRLGQTEPVRVVFYAYEGTAQEACLRVLGEKLLAAQAVEGVFSAEGLQALSSGRNAALQLANALVYGLDGLTQATRVWQAGELADAGEGETARETSPAPIPPPPPSKLPAPNVLTAFALARHRNPRKTVGQAVLF